MSWSMMFFVVTHTDVASSTKLLCLMNKALADFYETTHYVGLNI